MTNNNLTINEISDHLILRLDEIANNLFHDSTIFFSNKEIRIGNKGSLTICRNGTNRGLWKSFENDKGGNIFELIKYALNCDFKQALQWSKEFLNHQNKFGTYKENQTYKSSSKTDKEHSKLKTKKAKSVFSDSQDIKNSLAQDYLRSRAINITLPNSLRYNSSLTYFCNYQYKYPALVCSVKNYIGDIVGVHAIYLNRATKYKITCENTSKLSLGSIKNASVWLATNSSHAIVCEGVEDGLSLLQLYPDSSVFCTLGTSGMCNFKPPKFIKKVTIATDNDSAGIKASLTLSRKLKSQNIEVNIIKPPKGNDFNEYVLKYKLDY